MTYLFVGGPRDGERIDVPDGSRMDFPRPMPGEIEMFEREGKPPRDYIEVTNDTYEMRVAQFPVGRGGQRIRFFEHERVGKERTRIASDIARLKGIRDERAKVKYLRNAPKKLNFEKEISACDSMVEQSLTGLESSQERRASDFELEEKDRLEKVRTSG